MTLEYKQGVVMENDSGKKNKKKYTASIVRGDWEERGSAINPWTLPPLSPPSSCAS
jgi:hypothetical protein